MKIHKTIELCDRCHKEFEERDIKHYVSDWTHCYLLCDECNSEFTEYKEIVTDLERAIDASAAKYKFGKYLPEKPEGVDVSW